MAGRVDGKVALVTGAARGQGRAHAIRLAQEGADVVVTDVCESIPTVPYPGATKADLDATVAAIRALGRRVVGHVIDTRDQQAMAAAADQAVRDFGHLDVVVANAGICVMAPWDEVTPEIFIDTVDINVTGTWNTVMATAPHLARGGGGSIVLTSSVAGLKALPFLVPYVASKHAVTGMARAFAMELAKDNIRVNSLHPTGVRTGMVSDVTTANMERAIAGNPRLAGAFTNTLAIDITEPEDQANAVVFLASDESRFVTALAMTVDAGNSQY